MCLTRKCESDYAASAKCLMREINVCTYMNYDIECFPVFMYFMNSKSLIHLVLETLYP